MRPSLALASAASLVLARLATATPTVAANDTSLAERDIPLISGLTAALTAGVCLDVGFGVGLVTAPIVAGVDLDVCLCVNLDAALSLSKRGQQTPRVRTRPASRTADVASLAQHARQGRRPSATAERSSDRARRAAARRA